MKNRTISIFCISTILLLVCLSVSGTQQSPGKEKEDVCKDWTCVERHQNKMATIVGTFQKYQPNTKGKGANRMYWDWQILLQDSTKIPVSAENKTKNYSFWEGKKVRIVGTVFHGIIIGSAEGQNATGYRIDPQSIILEQE